MDRLSAVQNRLHAMEATIEASTSACCFHGLGSGNTRRWTHSCVLQMLRSEAADAQLRAEEHHSRTQEAVWKAQEAAASEMRIAEKLEKLRAEREMVEKEFQEVHPSCGAAVHVSIVRIRIQDGLGRKPGQRQGERTGKAWSRFAGPPHANARTHSLSISLAAQQLLLACGGGLAPMGQQLPQKGRP